MQSSWIMAKVSILGCILSLLLASGAGAERPNVLFIAVDDLKPAIGAYGDPYAITPTMDRLAQSGQWFEKAYCQYATCAPSRASLLTGLRPDSTRIVDLRTHHRETLPEVVTLPQHFGNEGYAVAGIGKLFHGGNHRNQDSEESFFGNWHYTPGSKKRYYEPGKSEAEDRRLAAGENFWEVLPSLTDRGPVGDEAYIDGKMTAKAMELLSELAANRNASGEPFFLAVGFKRPHLPFNAPDKYWAPFDGVDFGLSGYTGSRQLPVGSEPWTPPSEGTELSHYEDYPKGGIKDPAFARHLVAGYYASVSYVDALIGKLMAKLEMVGEADNTIIVLWGDHGWHLGDHDGWWAKHSNFEQATRSPLMIRYPGMAVSGVRNPRVVELVDIYPTLCDLAGLPQPDQPGDLVLQGKSMRPILEDSRAPWSDLAFSQYTARGNLMGHSLRSPRFRLTVWFERPQPNDPTTQTDNIELIELYDYGKDPYETHNGYGTEEYSSIAEKMMATLDAGRGWQRAR